MSAQRHGASIQLYAVRMPDDPLRHFRAFQLAYSDG